MTKKTVFLRTAYNYDTNAASNASGLVCEEPTRAQQHHKDECDINVILERFGKTGQMPVNAISGTYGDFSGVHDYHTALNTLIAAEHEFDSLPANIRKRFGNEPAKLIEFLNDSNNKEQAIELGLVNRPITSSNNEPEMVKKPVTDPSE
ncbi:MAG: internal scaffolding protein [Arizlama microvirus]|nr:MAG: internal scaffolding protein [Arizlama microvirus]